MANPADQMLKISSVSLFFYFQHFEQFFVLLLLLRPLEIEILSGYSLSSLFL
jgi:hypothetical protein